MTVPNTRAWNVLRLVLGFAQMAGAVFAATLIVITGGVSRLSLTAVVTTCALTSVSVLLFGSRGKCEGFVRMEQKTKRRQAALMENMLDLTAASLPHDEAVARSRTRSASAGKPSW